MKKIINKKVILVIILLVISITSVYAVTIIKASDVIYDNSKSGGSSNNVQGAIDELYGMAESGGSHQTLINENMVTYIEELSKSDKSNLAYDDTTDKNLRYIGSNPNNYVEFNGELWRIIGVMNNVKDASGNSASRVKIIRAESIGQYSYDNQPSGTGTSVAKEGTNDWTDSALMKMLNQGTYWNRTSGKCPYETSNNASSGTISCDLSNTGLLAESKSMISSIQWNIGGIKVEPSGSWTTGAYHPIPSKFYTSERGTATFTNGTITRPSKWTGYVGLLYPSDYGYSTGGSTRNTCLNTKMETVSATGDWREGDCKTNSWIFDSSLTQRTISSDQTRASSTFYVNPSGFVGRALASTAQDIKPVVYLDTKIFITKGKGTKSNPYKISYTEEIVEETCIIKETNKNLITYITNLSKTDKTNLVTDDTIDKNIRYVGTNPNNYVEFNGELWRILGIMNNVVDKNGLSSSRVKIIRNETIGGLSWDNKMTGVGSSLTDVGSNEWKDATIMKTLNSGPYWNRTSGICYDQDYVNGLDCDFSKKGLTSDAKTMISSVVWKLGASNTNEVTPKAMYSKERGSEVYSGRSKTWTGNVALIYPSDYGYAVGGSAREKCLATNLSQYNIDDCINNNWIYKNGHIWTLTPSTVNSSYVYRVHPDGNAAAVNANIHKDIIPTVYLNTDIELTKGIGTEEEPFIIKNG